MCTLETRNGYLETLRSEEGNEMYSGQMANLKCEELSFVKLAETNVMLMGHPMNSTYVVCEYDERQPKWVDNETGEEVVCDKECFNDEDCIHPGMGFCIDHR